MSSIAAGSTAKKQKPEARDGAGGWRELIESFIVALVLAFLFKSFVAEVFVIPTGSMAPTLMGAHKDMACPDCGYSFQAGASLEFDQNSGLFTNDVVIGGICPLCRSQKNLDLRNWSSDGTVVGDRIVVGKFNYLLNDPQRWDVIVFKYPQDARINYIKRLVGKPNEDLIIEHGDIYVRPFVDNEPAEGNYVMARKPADKVETLQQPVFDTNYISPDLVKAGWPSNMQPWPKVEQQPWKIAFDANQWEAEVDASANASKEPIWLRYYHRFPSLEEWRTIKDNAAAKLDVDPYTSTLITDFAAYNAMLHTEREAVYKRGGKEILANYKGGVFPDQGLPPNAPIGLGQSPLESEDGNHWVSDLLSEYEVEVEGEQSEIWLDLVECGVHLQCRINISTGAAELFAFQSGKELAIWKDAAGNVATEKPKANTAVRKSGKYRLKFANVDNQLVLWINGSEVKFSVVPYFDLKGILSENDQRPHWTEEDPLDAAPIGIAVLNGKMKIKRVRVWRDVYYIAVPDPRPYPYTDYPWDQFSLLPTLTDPEVRKTFQEAYRSGEINESDMLRGIIRWIYGSPTSWKDTRLFQLRRIRSFRLEEDQFFPMGDNSAASADARSWNRHYVPRELLIGKALVLLWPHRPVMLLPNVRRMGLIR